MLLLPRSASFSPIFEWFLMPVKNNGYRERNNIYTKKRKGSLGVYHYPPILLAIKIRKKNNNETTYSIHKKQN
jgi:hypothetical protein